MVAQRRGAAIEISGLRKDYVSGQGTVTALDNVDLKIAPGEFLCIVGPSGCGKSTRLQTILGAMAPLAGKGFVDDRDGNGDTQRRRPGLCGTRRAFGHRAGGRSRRREGALFGECQRIVNQRVDAGCVQVLLEQVLLPFLHSQLVLVLLRQVLIRSSFFSPRFK
mgnify:CR=1 FL=1